MRRAVPANAPAFEGGAREVAIGVEDQPPLRLRDEVDFLLARVADPDLDDARDARGSGRARSA